MMPLRRLLADPNFKAEEAEHKKEPEFELPSPYAEWGLRHLQSMYQKYNSDKDPKDFAQAWQGFTEITEPIDKATSAKLPVLPQ